MLVLWVPHTEDVLRTNMASPKHTIQPEHIIKGKILKIRISSGYPSGHAGGHGPAVLYDLLVLTPFIIDIGSQTGQAVVIQYFLPDGPDDSGTGAWLSKKVADLNIRVTGHQGLPYQTCLRPPFNLGPTR